MSFWLDETGRSPTYWGPPAYPIAEPAEPAPEQHEPALLYAPIRRERSGPIPWRAALAAVGAALALHAILLALFTWSASTPPHKREPAATNTMFASLVPASSLTVAPSTLTPAPAALSETLSDATAPSSQTVPPTADASPPPESRTPPSPQSAEREEANLNTSRNASPAIDPVHKDAGNPWAHASLAPPILSMEQKLWAAITPCLGAGPTERRPIRVIFGDRGSVLNMLDEQGKDAQVDPALKMLTKAIMACGPYDRLVPAAGSYVISAPG